MAAIQGNPIGHKISSHPVTSVRFPESPAVQVAGKDDDLDFLDPQPKRVTKSEIASVTSALLAGVLLVVGGAAVFGTALVWGVKLVAGL